VPDLAVRRYEVLPETVAPIVSLSEDPRMEPGMYLMVDMGAGTTEISINQVVRDNENSEIAKINCYFDRSIRLGGDDFDDLAGRSERVQAGAALVKHLKTTTRQVARNPWFSPYLQAVSLEPANLTGAWRAVRCLTTGLRIPISLSGNSTSSTARVRPVDE
jgi:hypothetical protein